MALEGLEARVVLTQVPYGLFDTGLNPAGGRLDLGAADSHYTLTATPQGAGSTAAVVAVGRPASWADDGDAARWVGPAADQSVATAASPAGTYRYQTTFTLDSIGGGTGQLAGDVVADDQLQDILINGVSTGTTAAADFGHPASFRVPATFRVGVNTVEFVVANSGDAANPTGLQVRDLSLTFAPTLAIDRAIVTIGSGGTLTNSGTFADLDANDPVTLTSSLGEVIATPTDRSPGAGSFTFSLPNAAASGPVTITATDSHGNAQSATFTINVVAPALAAGGNAVSTRSGGAAVLVNPNLVIDDPNGGNLTTASVAIGANFTPAEDVLSFTPQSGITGSYNPSTGILTLSGSATPAQYQAALRSVQYQDTNPDPITANRAPRTINFSIAPGAYDPANGHFYQFVQDPGITWSAARALADASNLYSIRGYLATITSEAENVFAFSKTLTSGWIGASDAAQVGDWLWVTGPEAGLRFYSGLVGGATVPGQFSSWDLSQPDNLAGLEFYAQFRPNGLWNDLADNAQVEGYLVEYGGTAGDPTLQLTASTTVNVTSITDTPIVTTPASATLTNRTTAPVAGTADAGSLVRVYNDANNNGVIDAGEAVVGSQQLAAGQASFLIDATLAPDAVNHLIVTATFDTASESAPAPAPAITSDTIPPAVTVTGPASAITLNATTYTVAGTAEAGSLVTIYTDPTNSGSLTGLAAVGTVQLAAGQTTYSFPVALAPNSANFFLVTAADAVGNVSAPVVVPTITTDSVAPVAPTVTDPAAAITVNAATYVIRGTAEAGSLVTITTATGSASVVGTQQLAAGQTTFAIPVALAANAANDFNVVAADAAGNVSAPVAVPTITTDSLAPALTVTDPASAITLNATTYTVAGTAEAGSLVTIYADPGRTGSVAGLAALGTVQLAAGQTTFAVAVPLAANSANFFLVTAADAVGNVSAPVAVPTITTDSVAPVAPVIANPTNSLPAGTTTVTITGTAEAGTLVQIYLDSNSNGVVDAGEAVLGSVQLAAGQAAFSLTVPVTAGQANNYLATATDAVGNVSSPAGAQALIQASQLPLILATITGTVFLDADVSGTSNAGDLGLPQRALYLDLDFSGTYTAGEPTTTSGANGAFSFTGLTLPSTVPVRQIAAQDVSYRYFIDRTTTFESNVIHDPTDTQPFPTTDATATIPVVPFSPVYPITLNDGLRFVGLNQDADANTKYVQALYLAVLDRAAGDAEAAAWVARLAAGASYEQVAAGVVDSPEHRQQQVAFFYQAYLHRGVDPGSQYWVDQFLAGASEQAVSAGILNSPEYQGAQADRATLVSDLYLDVLGRVGGDPEVASYLGTTQTPAELVDTFVNSLEGEDLLLTSLYASSLRRRREADGSAIWATALTARTAAGTVAAGILSSPEFRANAATSTGATVPAPPPIP